MNSISCKMEASEPVSYLHIVSTNPTLDAKEILNEELFLKEK